MLPELHKEAEERMGKTLDAMAREFSTVRTGKASPQVLDSVKVEVYGTTMPLNQVATVTVPEPRLLVVQAFDKATVGDIVKAIQKADLGFNPQADGQIIRLPIPALNEERRKELARHCKNIAEEGRVAIRNIRRDINERIKKAQKDKEISEDQQADDLEKSQQLTNDHIKKIDELLAKKEKEVMEV
ncbi:MAG: ribosome recycling factor [bacterium]